VLGEWGSYSFENQLNYCEVRKVDDDEEEEEEEEDDKCYNCQIMTDCFHLYPPYHHLPEQLIQGNGK
jgi:hypothetical protein